VAAELLIHAARTGALRPGLTLIGGKGFAGREFEDLVTTGYGMSLLRPDRRDETPRHGTRPGRRGRQQGNRTAGQPPRGVWPAVALLSD